ncbi:MAG: Uncharacterized protein CEN88_453 [Candidatus Berkelbacteria bacterium Licking1014_2]|uniref:Uncharacterized protein n=1 Tax=Candidatus Berkelbacteria bacterium Licking1014_2 TaxID=2017146 RepID=A0A554LRU1_9BACT|nr:MAG: Uncharacterized protein CEN88_453 [Candidatus Berkelbacteria bacterium Licking1014_2]
MKVDSAGYQKIIAKIDQKKLDLSADEDLSLAIMNLVSIEEHLFFTGQKTGRGKYLDLLKEVREMRKELLKKIVKQPEGEVWCLSKHLLAAAMRLMEVGTKKLAGGDKKTAEDLFAKSYQLYNLFWGINLKLIDPGEIKSKKDPYSPFAKLGQIIQKIVDCCRE